MAEKEYEPKIIGFFCNWCTYAGADLAGVSRLQYPPNIRVIRVMCSGTVSPHHVLRAFQKGADGVLIGGCHIGDCHYLKGNYMTIKRMTLPPGPPEIHRLRRRAGCTWNGSPPPKVPNSPRWSGSLPKKSRSWAPRA